VSQAASPANIPALPSVPEALPRPRGASARADVFAFADHLRAEKGASETRHHPERPSHTERPRQSDKDTEAAPPARPHRSHRDTSPSEPAREDGSDVEDASSAERSAEAKSPDGNAASEEAALQAAAFEAAQLAVAKEPTNLPPITPTAISGTEDPVTADAEPEKVAAGEKELGVPAVQDAASNVQAVTAPPPAPVAALPTLAASPIKAAHGSAEIGLTAPMSGKQKSPHATKAAVEPENALGDEAAKPQGPVTPHPKLEAAVQESATPAERRTIPPAGTENTPDSGATPPDGARNSVNPALTIPAGFSSPADPALTIAPGPKDAAEPARVPVMGLAAEIAARSLEGKRRFEIRLDPPELGRIDVRLDVDKHGQVTSRLIVERAETLDLLRRDAPALERALQSSGLRTDDAGLQFSLRDQPGQQWSAPEPAGRPNLLIVPDDNVAVQQAVRRGYGALRGLGRGLDIQV
jgi:flagellar hook-length control protein FliK